MWIFEYVSYIYSVYIYMHYSVEHPTRFIAAQEGVNYVANCLKGQLQLAAESGDFVLHADQTLQVPAGAQSPRCQQANKAPKSFRRRFIGAQSHEW